MYRKTEPLSTGKIETYRLCPYAYFLDAQTRESSLPISGFTARHYWLTNAMRKLFPDERFVGPGLDDVESLRGEELARYLNFHSPETFANATKEMWRMHVIENGGNVHGRETVWLYHSQWWKAALEIRRACANFYAFLLEEGPPVLVFSGNGAGSDWEIAFNYGERKFATRIGLVRKGLVIGEYDTTTITQKKLDNDWSVTLKLLAFCTLAKEEAYRIKWNVPERWGGDIEKVAFRYYNLLRGDVMETTRSRNDIPAMLEIVEETENSIARREFEAMPSVKNCSPCRYNVINYAGEAVCSRKHPDVSTPVPMKEMMQGMKKAAKRKRVAEGLYQLKIYR